ncbi:putative virion core protein (lumpy skin disease virus) [Desulfosporosinus orientis DSM 765]|uniref:Putative virion core protein (Lumpy skin disease virus) n=1 Tax=Desulfosporosinus orientis (strain ATCC 19365 / DSM 765 / NCIMB 8382 / VKM B-1628 / Singapore I) TaxID=768706 RepID=G7W739_DESOD|nr:SPFH domain-containing protein [Desulfosporosinus orientis]AET70547.1 putative virion core protein (lumpy skin disease virus) [Desulfosporosinus orientis DSM 765]
MAIIDVIKYNGGSDVFAWKYPSEEIGTWTQLIVNESQEAILYKGGQALDLFTSGRHTLDTANIPLLNNLINIPFGGRSPFAAEVWYINKIFSLDIKWGTPSPIQLQDPKYKVFVPLRSYGQFGIQIEDSRKFLMKLVGTLPIFDKSNITKYFRGLYLTKVKDAISVYIMKKQVSVLEINAYLDELSEYLKEKMHPLLEDYGIKLVTFYVNDISLPEDDPAVMKLKEALAKRAEMNIVGYNYVQERSFDTLEGAATNPSSGQAGLMGAGMGLGMGVGIGGNFGQQLGGIAQTINTDFNTQSPDEAQRNLNSIICSNCGYTFSKNVKFCPECGNIYRPCTFCGADLKETATSCHVCGKETPKLCAKCGTLIPNSNIKFCPECGEPQIKACSNCGKVIQGDAKFCSECGTKI